MVCTGARGILIGIMRTFICRCLNLSLTKRVFRLSGIFWFRLAADKKTFEVIFLVGLMVEVLLFWWLKLSDRCCPVRRPGWQKGPDHCHHVAEWADCFKLFYIFLSLPPSLFDVNDHRWLQNLWGPIPKRAPSAMQSAPILLISTWPTLSLEQLKPNWSQTTKNCWTNLWGSAEWLN